MPYDPYPSMNPSDSGLLEGASPASGPYAPRGESMARSEPPRREHYPKPAAAPVDEDSPEEALADVPLPPGFLGRLRALVEDL